MGVDSLACMEMLGGTAAFERWLGNYTLRFLENT